VIRTFPKGFGQGFERVAIKQASARWVVGKVILGPSSVTRELSRAMISFMASKPLRCPVAKIKWCVDLCASSTLKREVLTFQLRVDESEVKCLKNEGFGWVNRDFS